MTKYLSIIAIFILLFTACKKEDPAKWNKEVSEIYNSYISDIEYFEHLISIDKIGDEQAIAVIKEKGQQIMERLNASVEAVTMKEMPDEAEQYQQSLIAVLEKIKKQIAIGLEFKNLNDKSTDIEIRDYAKKYDAASAETAKEVDIFKQEQQKFAKKHQLQ